MAAAGGLRLSGQASVRIGELSRELEKAPPAKGKGAGLPIGGKTKREALAAAGISTTEAGQAMTLRGRLTIVLAHLATQHITSESSVASPCEWNGRTRCIQSEM